MIIYMVSAVFLILLSIVVTVLTMVNNDENLSKLMEEACKGQENI